MNFRMHLYILAKVMLIEGILMLIPTICALFYGETDKLIIYLSCSAVSALLGLVISNIKPKNTNIYLKDGCVVTAESWLLLSLIGCVPFLITGEIPRFTDAVFETVSGFTTTGSSILTDVEALSHASLIWRSLTHWIGGMGVLVFLLAVVPMSGGSNMNLLIAESPGPSVGKLRPKVRSTAKALYLIYLGLTLLEILVLVIAGMPVFDSLCSAFGTAGTGGFGIRNDSFASYAPHIQWIVAVFMIVFGVNFNFYYLILARQPGKAFRMEEVRGYLLVILAAVAVICVNTFSITGELWSTLRNSVFQVATIITTTGFASTDFDTWPTLSKLILVSLMFIGACAGSTGGGIKISRFQIRLKTLTREIDRYLHPRTVKKIQMDGKPLDAEVIRSVTVYFMAFLLLFSASVAIVSIEGYDLVTSFTSVAATINNIGPGLAMVGPTQNFAFLSDLSKWVLIVDMLAGRLELFPLIIFLYPGTYRNSYQNKLPRIIR